MKHSLYIMYDMRVSPLHPYKCLRESTAFIHMTCELWVGRVGVAAVIYNKEEKLKEN